ncbi:hypothetical protein BO83DRAFT_390081 [Aspergillus eucalypticola CBS 122712]|uniref:Uncharacterized protein n=1 Tax=Aspergillus eucalypticola (strain CBS 122712 / IBT 29274) TaxID=1448314 RepID=A0A317VDL1_ASPEC|nr:uncharacterized protein BO83DRAFT_390081 [Aspergillus eucalypticola CBS 122712]PWY69970.1 hypothetical protein BO83DRAFT_390081 [Aspergillus eucalypticola CBS 122712]
MSWPIFEEVRLQTTLISLTLADQDHGLKEVANNDVNLALIPDLIDRFLQFVHVKNPVVNTVVLRQSAVRVEVGESSRNAYSCLVACRSGRAETLLDMLEVRMDEANFCDLSSDLRAELDIPDSITNDSQWSPANLSYMRRTAADLESSLVQKPTIHNPRRRMGLGTQLRSWLYRPFVYYAIHHDDGQTNENEEAMRFMRKAIECSFHMINSKATQHRHHGTWFVARDVLSSALLIIAAAKADKVLVDYLADWPDLLDQAIRSLTQWALEARDLACAAVVLANLKKKLCT